MMRRALRNQGGFSLVEILMVIVIMSVVIGTVYSLFSTYQKTTYTQEETVEVQQNLRIAMDMLSRDIHAAGMLVDYGKFDPAQPELYPLDPIRSVLNDSGPNGSDGMVLNMASATGKYARIDADVTPLSTSASFPLAPSTTLDSPVTASSRITSMGDGDILQVDDQVRIFRALQNEQPAVADPIVESAVFLVTAVVRQEGLKGISTAPATAPTTAPAVTLEDLSGISMSGIDFKRGDIIAKVNATDTTTPDPNTIEYGIVSNAAAPATTTTDPNCPVNQRCLARRLNDESSAGNPVWQIVAQNISNLQLTYLLDDNSTSDDPSKTERSKVKAVMIVISGETVKTRHLSGNSPKNRQLTAVVKLRNRR